MLGALTAVKNSDTTGTGTGGQLTWTYTVAASAVEYLAPGQTKVESFTITLDDQNGSLLTRRIDVTLTGTNDAPVVTTEVLTGGVTEQAVPSGNLATSGSIGFSDVDLTDVHLVSPTGTAIGSVLGSLTAVKNTDTTSSGTGGQLTWSYSVAASAVEYLAAGQTQVERFTITLDDQNGSVTTRQIDVTITGTDDVPVVTAQELTGAITEPVMPSGTLEAAGAIAFADADQDDVHAATVIPVGDVLGSLEALTTADTTGATGPGRIEWRYRVDAAALEYLAAGQTRVELFDIVIGSPDGQGSSVTRRVEITLTGSNDAPVITAQTLSGAVREALLPIGNLASSGQIEFIDADLADVHRVTPVATPIGSTLGSVSAVKLADTTGTGAGGRIGWTYTVAAADVEYLTASETKLERFELTLDDGQGGRLTRLIEIAVGGINHAPLITAADASATLAEADTPSGALTQSGTLRFSDVDLGDVHRVTAIALDAAPLGTLVATRSAQAPGSGEITWTYRVDASAVEYLAAGETRLERFEIAIDDGQDGMATQEIVVTIVGGNDAPTASAEVRRATLDEPDQPVGRLNAAGTIDFADADLSDTHRVAPLATPVGPTLGSLAASLGAAATGGVRGSLDWAYSVAAADIEYLAAGETRTETFAIAIDDGHGGVLVRQVAITLVGSNDAPRIVSADASGEVNEMATPVGRLADSGSINFRDADLADVHQMASLAAVGDVLGSLTLVRGRDSTGVAGAEGQFVWNYSVAAADLEYLAAGETRIERFDVTLTDGHGGLATQRIEIALHGSNDAPVVVTEQLAATVADPATASESLGASGSIVLSDIDASDRLSVSPAGVAVGTALGKLKATLEPAALGSPARVSWTYDVAAADVKALAAGQTRIERYDLTLDDQKGGVVVRRIEVTLTGSNDAPVLVKALPGQPVAQNRAFAFSLPSPAFVDVDSGDTLTYAATLAGGEPLPGWLRFDAATQAFSGTPPPNQAGILMIRVTASDAAGAAAVGTFALEVASVRELSTAIAPIAPVAAPVVVSAPAPAATAPAPAPLAAPPTLQAPVRSSEPLLGADAVLGGPVVNTVARVSTALVPNPRSSLASASDLVLAQAVVADFGSLQLTPLMQTLQSSDVLRKLEEIQRLIEEQTSGHQTAVASSIALTTGLSVGYVIWLVRGGLLLSSVLSAMPAWQMIDPLPVLTRSRGRDDDDDEGGEDVEKLFGRRAASSSAGVAASRLAPLVGTERAAAVHLGPQA